MNGTQSEEALEERKALDRITEAVATLEELYEYVPDAMYEMTHEGLNELINETKWQSKPNLIRRILPILLEDQLAQENGKGAAFSKKPLTPRELAIETVRKLNELLKISGMSARTMMATHAVREAIIREYFDAGTERDAAGAAS